MEKDLNIVLERVRAFAKNTGIANANPRDQYIIMVTEVGELGESLRKGNTEQAKDDIGDIFITAVNAAETMGLDFIECVNIALDTVESRVKDGRMVNGIFMKRSTLEEMGLHTDEDIELYELAAKRALEQKEAEEGEPGV